LEDDARISDAAADSLTDRRSEILLSAVVTWEIAIKRSLGKLEAPEDLHEALLGAGAMPLSITLEHTRVVAGLPWHHRDPFDRLLVAQAMTEEAVVVSRDERLSAYGVPVLW